MCEENDKFLITNYHPNRTIVDDKFIEGLFAKDERDRLIDLQKKYPNHVIRTLNYDLILAGHIRGYGGSVPMNWNGLVYQAKA